MSWLVRLLSVRRAVGRGRRLGRGLGRRVRALREERRRSSKAATLRAPVDTGRAEERAGRRDSEHVHVAVVLAQWFLEELRHHLLACLRKDDAERLPPDAFPPPVLGSGSGGGSLLARQGKALEGLHGQEARQVVLMTGALMTGTCEEGKSQGRCRIRRGLSTLSAGGRSSRGGGGWWWWGMLPHLHHVGSSQAGRHGRRRAWSWAGMVVELVVDAGLEGALSGGRREQRTLPGTVARVVQVRSACPRVSQ